MHAEECMRGDSDRVPAARKAANSATNSRATKTDQSCHQPTPPTDSAQLLSYMTSAGTACATTRHGRVEGMTQNCDASLKACKCVLCVLVGAVQCRRCAPNGGDAGMCMRVRQRVVPKLTRGLDVAAFGVACIWPPPMPFGRPCARLRRVFVSPVPCNSSPGAWLTLPLRVTHAGACHSLG